MSAVSIRALSALDSIREAAVKGIKNPSTITNSIGNGITAVMGISFPDLTFIVTALWLIWQIAVFGAALMMYIIKFSVASLVAFLLDIPGSIYSWSVFWLGIASQGAALVLTWVTAAIAFIFFILLLNQIIPSAYNLALGSLDKGRITDQNESRALQLKPAMPRPSMKPPGAGYVIVTAKPLETEGMQRAREIELRSKVCHACIETEDYIQHLLTTDNEETAGLRKQLKHLQSLDAPKTMEIEQLNQTILTARGQTAVLERALNQYRDALEDAEYRAGPNSKVKFREMRSQKKAAELSARRQQGLLKDELESHRQTKTVLNLEREQNKTYVKELNETHTTETNFLVRKMYKIKCQAEQVPQLQEKLRRGESERRMLAKQRNEAQHRCQDALERKAEFYKRAIEAEKKLRELELTQLGHEI